MLCTKQQTLPRGKSVVCARAKTPVRPAYMVNTDLQTGHSSNSFRSDQLSPDYIEDQFSCRVHKRFREVCPDIVPKEMTRDEAHTVRVPRDQMEKLPELKENPFRTRILEVFSRDGKGNLTFEDFLDLLSVFSEQAPRDIKVFYAFKIYDFDGDQHIGPGDIEIALKLLTHGELGAEEVAQVCEKAVEEADVDGDGKLSYMEFEHVILRAPDFLSTFHIRL